MPARVDPERRQRYLELRWHGHSTTAAARTAGVSRAWATTFDRTHPHAIVPNRCPLCGSPSTPAMANQTRTRQRTA